jgi:hypothetical protein
MNRKLSVILALLIAGGLPSLSLYAWHTGGSNVNEEDVAENIALTFLKNSPTFKFDGMLDTVKHLETRILESYPIQYIVVFKFESRHAGYGDRTGQMLAQVITGHKAWIKVVNNRVVSAVLDEKWDMIDQSLIKEASGDPGSDETTSSFKTSEHARDAAIRHLLSVHKDLKDLVVPSTWREKDLTPEGLLGSSKREYSSEGWTVTISWPVVLHPVYNVEIECCEGTKFTWSGTVNQEGEITETSFEIP